MYEKFNDRLLADRSCGQWRQGVLCVIQSLPHPDFGCVTRFAEWFCVRPSFLFSPSPLPHRKAWYSGYLQVRATQAILDCFLITLRPTSVPDFPPSILTIFTTSSSKFPQVLTVVPTNGRAGNRENDLGLRCHLYYRFHKTTTNSDKTKVSFWKSPLWWNNLFIKKSLKHLACDRRCTSKRRPEIRLRS